MANDKTVKSMDFKVKQLEGHERRLRFIGSSEAEDRDGDIILASGWELDNYKKNPVFLWAHDYKIPPVGKALNVAVVGNELHFDIQFPQKGIYPFADTVFGLYEDGFLNATSVGFIGKEGQPKANGTIFTRQELLELSAVPVPANPTALQQAKAKGYIPNAYDKYFNARSKADDTVIEIIGIGSLEGFIGSEYVEIDFTPEEMASMVSQSKSKANSQLIDVTPQMVENLVSQQMAKRLGR